MGLSRTTVWHTLQIARQHARTPWGWLRVGCVLRGPKVQDLQAIPLKGCVSHFDFKLQMKSLRLRCFQPQRLLVCNDESLPTATVTSNLLLNGVF